MKNLDLNGLGVQEMNAEEIREMGGGLVPLIIFGVVVSAKAVAWTCAGLTAAGIFGAGVYVGYKEAAAE